MARWFHDGSEVDTVSINDRGLQYADGLFETIALRTGRPRLWELHSTRMQTGCRRLAIDIPASNEILSTLTSVVDATGNNSNDALLKIVITRGEGDRGYAAPVNGSPTILIGVFAATEYPTALYRSGVAVRFCNARLSTQPQTAGIKLLSRLDQVLACSEWHDPDIAEGLMFDQDGYVVCGTRSNLFVVRDSKLITPAMTHCGVSGVMRQHILALADKHNLHYAVDRVSLDLLQGADELFLCNSQFGIWPISQCATRRIENWPITSKLMTLLRASGVIEGPA